MRNRYLVIGGNGFIGRNLCEYLLHQGETVSSFDLLIPDKLISGVKYISGNFFDDKTLADIVESNDIIFHCISTINPANSITDYLRGYETDFIQTIKLFDLIKGSNKKVIFLSSGGTVYGDVETMPITEDTPTNPKNYYGSIKLAIENFIRTYNKVNQTNHLIARISNPYGPGQDSNKGVGFIDAVIRNSMGNHDIEVWGEGDIVRDYIYIRDVCKMLYSLAYYNGSNQVFNLSSNCGETQNEIIELVKKYIPEMKVVYKPSRAIDAKKIVLCNDKIKQIMKEKLTSIDEGIRLYMDYLKGE